MKHIGATIKQYVEENGIKKVDLAKKVGISNNYLSGLFARESMDSQMLEKFCIALGISPMSFFEVDRDLPTAKFSNIKAQALGKAEVHINGGNESYQTIIEAKNRLIDEKERTIQILLAGSGLKIGTETRHDE